MSENSPVNLTSEVKIIQILSFEKGSDRQGIHQQ